MVDAWGITMTSELTELTLEAFNQLHAEHRVHQISPPFILSLPLGSVEYTKQAVEAAVRSRHAPAYMVGDSTQIGSYLIIPVTLYAVDSEF